MKTNKSPHQQKNNNKNTCSRVNYRQEGDKVNELILHYSNGEIPDFEFERLHYLAMTTEGQENSGVHESSNKPTNEILLSRIELPDWICEN